MEEETKALRMFLMERRKGIRMVTMEGERQGTRKKRKENTGRGHRRTIRKKITKKNTEEIRSSTLPLLVSLLSQFSDFNSKE